MLLMPKDLAMPLLTIGYVNLLVTGVLGYNVARAWGYKLARKHRTQTQTATEHCVCGWVLRNVTQCTAVHSKATFRRPLNT